MDIIRLFSFKTQIMSTVIHNYSQYRSRPLFLYLLDYSLDSPILIFYICLLLLYLLTLLYGLLATAER